MPVRLVTSTEFVRKQEVATLTSRDTTGTNITLVTADTTRRTLLTTVTRSLTETQRFYICFALTDFAEISAHSPVDAEVQLVEGEKRARVENDQLESVLRIVFTSFVLD